MTGERKRAAGPVRGAARSGPLTDLTDVDLRTLRAMDDPGMTAAVERVLRGSRGLTDVWHVGGEYTRPGKDAERSVPARYVEAAPGRVEPGSDRAQHAPGRAEHAPGEERQG